MADLKPELGSSSLAISQAVIAFGTFLPNFVEVGRSDKNVIKGEVRLGESAAVITALSVGALLGWLNGSAVPFYIAAAMAAVLIGLYEAALRMEV